MSNITAWIFPRTLPQESVLTPLVHVFPSLVYLQSVEDDPDFIFNDQPIIGALMEAGRVRSHVPAPLGVDRERFLSLVADVHNRRDDYRSMLSSLALANINAGQKNESKHSILSRLVGSAATSKPMEAPVEMLLWQARLVLKLGEMLDQEQREIANDLKALSQKQETLFAELREEANESFSLTRDISDKTRGTDEMLEHRLKAWTQIFSLGSNRPSQADICITGLVETLETIRDQYESTCRTPSPSPVRIELPVISEEVISSSETINLPPPSPSLTDLCQLLLNGIPEAKQTQILLDNWGKELEKLRRETKGYMDTTVQLVLQPFPGISSASLLLETFARNVPDTPKVKNLGGCIIGALEV